MQESELERLTSAREAEAKFIREQNEMEIQKSREMAEIETTKFKSMVDAIGANTLQAIATAGPEMQVCIPEKQSYVVQSTHDFLNFYSSNHP